MALRKEDFSKPFDIKKQDYYYPEFSPLTTDAMRELLRVYSVGSFLVFPIERGKNHCVAVKKINSTEKTSIRIVIVQGANPSLQSIKAAALSVFSDTDQPLIPCRKLVYQTADAFFDDCIHDFNKVSDYMFRYEEEGLFLILENAEKIIDFLLAQCEPIHLMHNIMKLLERQSLIGRNLLESNKLLKFVAENISFAQFYIFYCELPNVVKSLQEQPGFKFSFAFEPQFWNDTQKCYACSLHFLSPIDLIALMQFSKSRKTNLGHVLIQCNPDLYEIIQMQDLPIKFPEDFGLYKQVKISEMGIKASHEYDLKLLEDLGCVFLETTKQLSVRFIPEVQEVLNRPNLHIELGKMCIDYLNSRPISPSDELLNLIESVGIKLRMESLENARHKARIYSQAGLSHLTGFFKDFRQKGKEVISKWFKPLDYSPETLYFISKILFKTCFRFDPTNQQYAKDLSELEISKQLIAQPRRHVTGYLRLIKALCDSIREFNSQNRNIELKMQRPRNIY